MFGSRFMSRKRFRPNGMSSGGRFPKRARTSKPRRRRTNFTSNSNRGKAVTAGYSRKRLNKKRYARILRDASLVGQHYRSVLSSALVTTTSPANIQLATCNALKMVASNFWTTAGGFTVGDFTATPTFNDSDLTIRGGKSSITFVNNAAQCVRVRSWRGKTTDNGVLGAILNASVSAAWDPSHETTAGTNVDFHKNFKFFDLQEDVIEPNDTVTRSAFIKAHKVDQDLFNQDSKVDFWIYMVSGMLNSTAVPINVTTQHNLSFTGDSGV